MPVQQRSIYDRRADDERYQSLRQWLVDEWRGQGSIEPRPYILEETDANGRVVNVIVTWDEWTDLDAQTRSELIVDAFQVVKEPSAIAELALAMGLTSSEKSRLASQ